MCVRIYEIQRNLVVNTYIGQITYNLKYRLLDDIFFYEQAEPEGVIVMLGDVVVGVTDAQIKLDENAGIP